MVREINFEGQVVPRKDTFRYLESMLQINRDIDEDVNDRTKTVQTKWHLSI